MPFRFRLRHLPPLGLTLLAAACAAVHKPDDAGPPPDAADLPGGPLLEREKSMMSLARDLDHLERHIDWHGSVVAKVPDVWGQARLTRYREEIETQLAKDVDQFKPTISGSTVRADQSFAAGALSLSAALQGTTAPTATQASALVSPQGTLSTVTALPTFVPAAGPGQFQAGIGLEQVEILGQKNRYLNYLAQLRRNNEGDDTADSPGYALTLMRVPVSVLPGKRTDCGYGAEVTMTVHPVLGDDLLPATFRNLVIAGLTKELGYPLTKFLDDTEDAVLDSEIFRLVVRNRKAVDAVSAAAGEEAEGADDSWNKIVAAAELLPRRLNRSLSFDEETKKTYVALYGLVNEYEATRASCEAQVTLASDRLMSLDAIQTQIELDPATAKLPAKDQFRLLNKRVTAEYQRVEKKLPSGLSKPSKPASQASRKRAAARAVSLVTSRVDELTRTVSKLRVPFSTGTRERQSIPFSQYLEVYGSDYAFEIAFQAQLALKDSIATQGYAHLPDVQSFLQVELDAAYRLLRRPEAKHLWDAYCTPDMVSLVRTRNVGALFAQRERFRFDVMQIAQSGGDNKNFPDKQTEFSSTAALTWMILVHSALLNDRLLLDIKETASHKQAILPVGCEWLDFYLPCPSAEARAAFNAYVRLRWPVKVFALDPDKDEQNLTDALSVRRETQLALAVAFAAGNINGNTYNKFARKLDADYQTIDLNRTQVGFGHGENVFGWRFYPRFQTPDTKSNLSVLVRDQLIGGPSKTRLIHERRLEPGMRECTALVIMPSFVPYVTVESTSNWFNLTNPKHKVLDHTQALKLSQRVKAVTEQGPNVADACKYRDGDQGRLLERARQLEARLPMQTLAAQVPVEENLAGFELFVHGTSDFAPELYGWYGAPGIDQAKENVTLFLVGNHFSVTQSRVIIGNAEVLPSDVKMISRQVMQVKVPKTAIAYTYAGDPHVVTTSSTTPKPEPKPAEMAADPDIVTTLIQENTVETKGLNGTHTDAQRWQTVADRKTVSNQYIEESKGPISPRKKLYINIHVATPYGVTRELAVPAVVSAKPDPEPAAPAPAELKTAITLRYTKTPKGQGLFTVAVVPATDPLELKWPETAGAAPAKAKAKLTFTVNGCPLEVDVLDDPKKMPPTVAELDFNRTKGAYTLTPANLETVVNALNARLFANGTLPFTDDSNPLKPGEFAVKAVLESSNPKKTGSVERPLTWKFSCSIP